MEIVLIAAGTVWVPLAGLIYLGRLRERRRMEALIREHASRLERFRLVRGGV